MSAYPAPAITNKPSKKSAFDERVMGLWALGSIDSHEFKEACDRLFDQMSPTEKDTMASLAEPVYFQSGDELVSTGKTSTSLFVVVQGQVKMDALGWGRSGSVHGINSALFGKPESWTVRAVGNVSALSFDISILRRAMRFDSRFRGRVCEVLAGCADIPAHVLGLDGVWLS